MIAELARNAEGPICEAFNRAIDEAKTQPISSPDFEQLVLSLASNDMNLLESITDCSKLLVHNSEIVFKVLEFAHHRATSAETREQVRAMATRIGFGPRFQKRQIDLGAFTASQRSVLKTLHAMAELMIENQHSGAKNMRLQPLLLGPSGTGKTHTVRALGEQLNLPVLRICAADWIVSGAAKQTCTLEVLLRFLNEKGRFVLLLDEMDKINQNQEPSLWGSAQLAEIYGVLDRSITYTGTSSTRWTEKHNALLKNEVFIVGSATFQQVWNTLGARKMGFSSDGLDLGSVAQAVRKAQVMPEELLNRFTDDWLLIHPYSESDFTRIARRHKISRRVMDPSTAAASGLNYRFVEAAVTNAAVKNKLRTMKSDRVQTLSCTAQS